MPKELDGFRDYYNTHDHLSLFEQLLDSKAICNFHLHGHEVVTARVVGNDTYDVTLEIKGQEPVLTRKIDIKFASPPEQAAAVQKLLKKSDKKVKAKNLEPIERLQGRNFVKNKTLYPLMKDRQVVFFTLLEGEIIRGLIADFSRYEIIIHLKGGIPLTLLRHSIFDLRDKSGRCFLKSVQDETRDWQKSVYYVEKAQ